MAYSREKIDMDALVKNYLPGTIESVTTKGQRFYLWGFIPL